MTKFYPTKGKVAVLVEAPQQAEGEIIYEEKGNPKIGVGKVVSIGPPELHRNGNPVELHYKEGDRVLFEKDRYESVREYTIMHQFRIFAVVEEGVRIG
tara:strand:- start:268 stop:561 length:294 start_codon:yes stop_codon:yes gene_type:complete